MSGLRARLRGGGRAGPCVAPAQIGENTRRLHLKSRITRRGALAWLAGAAAAPMAPAARAQASWPAHSIRFVVPFAPGGTSEIVARSVAVELTRQLGVSVFVENKPGGAGTVAMAEVAKAAPDGHTIILGHVGTLAVNPYMLSKPPYDANRDFIAVTLLAKVPRPAHPGS